MLPALILPFLTNTGAFLPASDLDAGMARGGFATAQATRQLPTTHAERRKLAERLARDWAKLTDEQRQELRGLGRDAWEALLKAFEAVAKTEPKQLAQRYEHSEQMRSLMVFFSELFMPSDTLQLAGLYRRLAPDSDASGLILRLLVAGGEPSVTTPLFLQIMRRKHQDGMLTADQWAVLDHLAQSRDPRVVAYLTEQLRNPRAPAQVRQEAYIALPTTGEKGLEAVLDMADRARGLPPLEQRMELTKLPASPIKRRTYEVLDLVAVRRSGGATYGLIRSAILGSRSDLFIARREGGRWRRPVFTGEAQPPEGGVEHSVANMVSLRERERRLIGGNWTALLSSPAVVSDNDGDGLTDLVEARLGTNPRAADSDSDGIVDSNDRNPLVAPRELTEEERAVEAAFEALFRFYYKPTQLVTVEFKGKPFEIFGPGGWVLPHQQRHYDFFGLGIGFLDYVTTKLPNGDWQVDIGASYAGTAGAGNRLIVRRFGKHWVVVKKEGTWMS